MDSKQFLETVHELQTIRDALAELGDPETIKQRVIAEKSPEVMRIFDTYWNLKTLELTAIHVVVEAALMHIHSTH